MRRELKENYGVEKVTPLKGQTITDVYHTVKEQGSFIKEKMICSAEESARKTRAKQKEWKKKAVKRVTPRRMEMERRKAAEAAAKRSIRL